MTERPQDKSNKCGRAISEIERTTWNGLLNIFKSKIIFNIMKVLDSHGQMVKNKILEDLQG